MRFFKVVPIALTALVFLSGCAPTTWLASTWVDPGIKTPLQFKKVLVVVISSDIEMRKQAEGYLTVLMQKTEGVPAYMAIPEKDLKDRAKIEKILKENGYDGVITVRLVSVDQETNWIPASYPDLWGYYGWAWPYVYQPGYLVTDTTVGIETKIYSVADAKLVWAGLSETFNPKDFQQFAKDLAKAIGDDLKKRGLVA